MKWNEAKPLVKRLLIATVIFPPIMAFSHSSKDKVSAPKPVQDTLRVYRAEPRVEAKPVRKPLLLNERCVGVQAPAP